MGPVAPLPPLGACFGFPQSRTLDLKFTLTLRRSVERNNVLSTGPDGTCKIRCSYGYPTVGAARHAPGGAVTTMRDPGLTAALTLRLTVSLGRLSRGSPLPERLEDEHGGRGRDVPRQARLARASPAEAAGLCERDRRAVWR